MTAHGGLIMLSTPTPDYESPTHHRETCAAARRWSQVPWVIDGVLVHVADVGQHRTQTRAAGARMLSAIETDFPGPRYRAEDVGGHRWMFLARSSHG
jgi:PhnB protein